MRIIPQAANGWIIGSLALVTVTTITVLDVSRDGLNWQAGPVHISMDVKADRSLAIKFGRIAPRRASGFAETQTDHQGVL